MAELAKCSRNVANEIIENQRVFINYENESRSSKLLSEGDVIVIRGKGKFIVKLINGETRKGKLSATMNTIYKILNKGLNFIFHFDIVIKKWRNMFEK